MLSIFWKDKKATILLLLFVLFTGWWALLRLHVLSGDSMPDQFAGTYGLLALMGGIWGIMLAKRWGGFKSVIGRAILIFSIGLLLQEFGQLAYAYYAVVKKVEVPYPSIGDLGYFGSIPLYIYGAVLLAKASGAKVSLRSIVNKVQAILIPLAILAISYFFFLRGYQFDWSHPLTIFLDFGYPFGQAIYISVAIMALLLSRKLLGGIMRSKILLILFALCAQYASDFNFLFQSSHQTWMTAGYGDALYMFSYFLMTLSLVNLGRALLPSTPAPTSMATPEPTQVQSAEVKGSSDGQ